ncbi:MAG TPA: hypothetical protein VGI83_09870 [Gemmatimonadales bacterium]|jgi:hypothetical protein
MRVRFVGGFYGQLVSGLLWLTSAALATWSTPRAAITTALLGGFAIFPLTELFVRLGGAKPLSQLSELRKLGPQVALVMPLCIPLLIPVVQYKLNLFFPALMILLGAHYLPFVFLYGMRMFGVLAALILGGGVMLLYWGTTFSGGAWYTGAVLLVFAIVGKATVRRESRG